MTTLADVMGEAACEALRAQHPQLIEAIEAALDNEVTAREIEDRMREMYPGQSAVADMAVNAAYWLEDLRG